jgi:hypothetical protein
MFFLQPMFIPSGEAGLLFSSYFCVGKSLQN